MEKVEDDRKPSIGRNVEEFVDLKKTTVSLPKIIIKKFCGEPTAWQEFHDTFGATVGENNKLSDIEKFTYLKGYLSGEAERCIEGLALTKDNYREALEILEERYGNRQLIVASHMNRILKLECVTSCKTIKPLRSLYDQVEGHVRSLYTVGVKSQEYGPLLIPIIVEKLPEEIKLEISRKLGRNNWMVDEFLKILKDEIVARESCSFMKYQEKNGGGKENATYTKRQEREENDNRPFSAEALTTAARRTLVCAFCKGSHYHDKCSVVTDVQKRRDIIKQKRLCFRCLIPGHIIRKCRNKNKCFQCKSNNHHTAI